MDTNHYAEDELNGLERRLAAWRPADPARGADAVLFAAGRASAPGSRVAWVAAVAFAVVALALGVWGGLERSARFTLAQQIREQPPEPAPPAEPYPEQGPSPGNYLTVRSLVVAHGVDAWPTLARSDDSPPSPDQPGPTTLRAWRRGSLLDP